METHARQKSQLGPVTQTAPATQARHEATYRDVLDAPPGMVAELLNGALHTFPRPSWPQAASCTELCTIINQSYGVSAGKPGGWRILHEPQLRLGRDVLVPDIAGWRFETLDPHADIPESTIAPDWACEVLSLSTEEIDRNVKREIYAREGVPHLWLVDPRARALEILELRERRFVRLALLEGDAEVSMPPFREAGFKLGWLWGER